MEDVILVMTGDKDKIVPLQSVGRHPTELVVIHVDGIGYFWATNTEHYKGEQNPIAILIDNHSFEPKILANQLPGMIDELQKWHPGIPILQLRYIEESILAKL